MPIMRPTVLLENPEYCSYSLKNFCYNHKYWDTDKPASKPEANKNMTLHNKETLRETRL